MRIDELALTAFGRFHGERLQLAPGLNLIYGPNEAGKSTLQKFLLGMLYGFKKPGARREYTADAERYRPWAGLEYRGSLTYTLDDGRQFRAERLFEPGRDTVRLFDASTGADLTASFPLDRRKELRFADAHCGLDAEAFRSTAWVGQLSVGQLEAGRELVARVANLQEAGREDLSVQQALAYLDEQLRAIGTERAATRPYGRVVKALGAVRQELERAEATRAELQGWETELAELQAALAELEGELAATREHRDRAVLAEAEERLRRLDATVARLRELEATAEALAPCAAFSQEGLWQLRQLTHEAEAAEAAAAGWGARAAALVAEGAALGEEGPMARYGAEAARALDAAELAERTCAARLTALRTSADQLQSELRQRTAPGLLVALGAGAAVGLVVAVLATPLAGVLAGVLAATLAVALQWRAEAGRRRGLDAQLAALAAEQGALEQEVAERQAEAARLAACAMAASAVDPAAFRRAYAAWQTGREKAASLARQAEEATARATAETARAARATGAVASLLAAAGIATVAEYEAAAARREDREQALAEASALRAGLAAMPEDLAATVADLRSRVTPGPVTRSSTALQAEVAHLEKRRADLTLRAGELGARLETAARDAADPAELRRQLAALLEEKAGYDAEIAALELARSTIGTVAAELHREFAPRLNQRFGAAVASVTGGRYTRVQVDEQAGIRVLTPDDRTVGLDQLSGGTVDQIYLALRIALLDLVTAEQERLPLLLDDPFVQYDDQRAASALRYLTDIARDRQVLLLTCHRREVALARQSGAPFHLLTLGDAATED